MIIYGIICKFFVHSFTPFLFFALPIAMKTSEISGLDKKTTLFGVVFL